MSTDSLKQELLLKIARLPEHRLREALDYISYLLFQEQRSSGEYVIKESQLDPDGDPLLQFIGRVAHGSLAQGIDEELYGT